ncbi:YihY/virulence factor BrkB family protein [Microbacter sp. GSS18]|nr:YihY/virulence factor BrkB family protein [Microbacter sp. GSS18]
MRGVIEWAKGVYDAVMRLVKKVIAWVLTLKIVRAFLLYVEKRGPMLSDGITYRALFSIFAGVLLTFSFAALWLSGNPDVIQALIGSLDAVIPGLVGPDGIIDPENIAPPAGLTLTGIISAIGLVMAAIGAITSLRIAMRTIASTNYDDIAYVWKLMRNLLLAIGTALALVASAVVTFLGTYSVDLVLGWLDRPDGGPADNILTTVVTVGVVYLLDVGAIIALFLMLSGVKPPARALWAGALLGGFGLTVLQQLSGLFVGGATSNPLLASFASLIALLLWVNLSVQVVLIAAAYIVVGVREAEDRVRFKYGAATFAQRKVRQAEVDVQTAADALRAAREAEEKERTGS